MSCRKLCLHFSLIAPLILLVVAGSLAAPGTSRHSISSLQRNVIHVWNISSPYRAEIPKGVPLDIQNRAKALGYTVELTNFLADGFEGKFAQAFREHNEPEILTFDNLGILIGLNGPSMPHIEGILNENGVASSIILEQDTLVSLQPRGWVLLLHSAANYEAAKALAMQPEVCSQQFGGKAAANPDLQGASDFAVAATRAYVGCDTTSLTSMSDSQKLSTKCLHPDETSQVDQVETCSISGNENLAFAFVGSSFSAQAPAPRAFTPFKTWFPNAQLGHQTLMTIVRKEGGKWRLLAISGIPVTHLQETKLQVTHIANLLVNNSGESVPTPAQVTTPDGTYPKRQGNQFGDLTWKPSTDPDVVAEVAEFVLVAPRRQPDGSLPADEPTRYLFVNPTAGRISTGMLFGGGRFSWRVWSINKTGGISFSDPRWYIYP